jgi:hypothetical protein
MTQVAHSGGAPGVRTRSDGGSFALTGREWAHGYTAADIETDRTLVAMYASLCRAIAGAPVQNKLVVFGVMARTAARDAAAHRQQVIDELWEVATGLGLIDLFGVTSVQDVLATAFAGEAS